MKTKTYQVITFTGHGQSNVDSSHTNIKDARKAVKFIHSQSQNILAKIVTK